MDAMLTGELWEKVVRSSGPLGSAMINCCPSCGGDHETAINEEAHQNELLAGYWGTCPINTSPVFLSVSEVQ